MIDLSRIPEVPEHVLHTYARLWQLETWLRRIIYIELRARYGDEWKRQVPPRWEGPRKADKNLTHMPTPEDDPLSYTQLSGLCQIIADDWQMFSPMLPPRTLWDAKLEEVKQIRHRVAHFRIGHQDDLARVLQLIRDLDKSFWTFCTSYNNPRPVLPASDDPVVTHFLHLDPFPWSQVGENEWARIGSADPTLRVAVTVEIIRSSWAVWSLPIAGKQGFLYDVHLTARGSRRIDYSRLLDDTLKLHERVVHILLDKFFGSVRLTIPAVIGEETVTRLVERFHEAALHSLTPLPAENNAQLLADAWPEYVLGPENPLAFLGPGMPCSFFGA